MCQKKKELSPKQTSIIYASEADVLNMALFSMTAKQWRDSYPDKEGNLRDYASINALICLQFPRIRIFVFICRY